MQICERGMTPREKINIKDKHYTLLGLTTLDDKPVICIVIFSGIQPNVMVETGLDLMAETIGNATDEYFFEKTVAKERNLLAVPCANSNVNRFLVSVDGSRRDKSQKRF